MAVFCQVITVSQTEYPDDPQIVLPFEPSSITAQFMGGTDAVSISFGGGQDAAILLPDILSPGSFYDWTNQRWVRGIYMKTETTPSVIQIIAEE